MNVTNNITLIGNLGQDPETKTLPSGTTVCEMSIATSDTYRNREGEKITRTEWHRVKAFGKLADVFAQHLRKGSKVCISGTLRYSKWTDKHEQSRTSAEIIAEDFTFLDSRRDDEPRHEAPRSETKAAGNPEALVAEGDELPF